MDRVIQACSEVIAIEGDPYGIAYNRATAYSNRCYAYIFKREYDRAIADCDKAIESNPDRAKAYKGGV